MENMLTKFLYTGVGLAAIAVEKIQSSVEKLIKEDKLSAEEGKRIMDDIIKSTKTKKEEFELHLKGITEKVVQGFKFVTEKELEELIKRVEALEKKVKSSGKKPVKSSTKSK
jgi:polyhydroxyalkanoate synthesis regulator phasin